MLPTSTAANPAGYVIDAWGGLHPFGSAPKITQGGYWPGWDIARDVIINPNGPGGWVLDGWGGLSPFNGAPPVNISRYWPGWDIARGAAIYQGPNGLTGYVLDGWGSLNPINNAPALIQTRYWPNRDYRALSRSRRSLRGAHARRIRSNTTPRDEDRRSARSSMRC